MKPRLTHILVLALLVGTYGSVGSYVWGAVSTERDVMEEALKEAIDTAAVQYRSGRSLPGLLERYEKELKENEKALQELARKKRTIRLKIASALETVDEIEQHLGIEFGNEEQTSSLLVRERAKFRGFIRYLHARQITLDGNTENDVITDRVLVASLGEQVDEEIQDRAVSSARRHLLALLSDAQSLPDTIEGLRESHEELIEEYNEALFDVDAASQKVQLTRHQIQQIKEITAEVHQQILRMQSQLARYDAKIKARAERKLIEMGLRDARPGSRSKGEVKGPMGFNWPAYGAISAGFMDPGYERFFGVPHRGMDIVVGQGTPIHAAADGIVFLARDGGQTGYSYILIGHRNGYATLYGHMLQIHVTSGQDIEKGDVVGLSGGQPGTYGAGPMTTGPHLHFEVIKNGVNVNPRSVLP